MQLLTNAFRVTRIFMTLFYINGIVMYNVMYGMLHDDANLPELADDFLD